MKRIAQSVACFVMAVLTALPVYADNEASQEISEPWIFVILIAALLVIGGVIFYILTSRRY